MKPARLCLLFVLFVGPPLSSAQAGESFYVMIFGSQPTPKRFKDSHTWATFVKANGEGTDPAGYALETFTLSWVPASFDVKILSPHPEPGLNLDLYQTLEMTRRADASVTMWGPFQIRPEFWNRAVEVWNLVQSGAMRYRAIDTARNKLISDCIHVVSDVDPEFGRNHYPLIRVGKSASRYIAKQLAKRTKIDQSVSNNEWVYQALGLPAYGIKVIPPSQVPDGKGMSHLAPRATQS